MSVKFTSKGLADGTDSTKELEFNVSGVTTGTTRTITVPDSNLTLAGANTAQTFTTAQRGTLTTDNDGSFDMNATNNFKCTPAGNFTLTFTNITSGQSGYILLVNTGGHTVAAASTTKVDANLLATVSTAGTYLIGYFSDGTNVYLTNSAVYA